MEHMYMEFLKRRSSKSDRNSHRRSQRTGYNTDRRRGFAKFKEIQYNILADALRKHMDISRIYEIMEEGTDDED